MKCVPLDQWHKDNLSRHNPEFFQRFPKNMKYEQHEVIQYIIVMGLRWLDTVK